jgi:hypothetical protein
MYLQIIGILLALAEGYACLPLHRWLSQQVKGDISFDTTKGVVSGCLTALWLTYNKFGAEHPLPYPLFFLLAVAGALILEDIFDSSIGEGEYSYSMQPEDIRREATKYVHYQIPPAFATLIVAAAVSCLYGINGCLISILAIVSVGVAVWKFRHWQHAYGRKPRKT